MHFSACGFTPDWLAALHVFESERSPAIHQSQFGLFNQKTTYFPWFFILAWYGIYASYHGVLYIGDPVNKAGIDASGARHWGKTQSLMRLVGLSMNQRMKETIRDLLLTSTPRISLQPQDS